MAGTSTRKAEPGRRGVRPVHAILVAVALLLLLAADAGLLRRFPHAMAPTTNGSLSCSSEVPAGSRKLSTAVLLLRKSAGNLVQARRTGNVTKRSATSERPPAAESTRTSLNGHGIFAIIVFAAVSLIVIQPVKIRVPQRVAGSIRRVRSQLWNKLVGEQEQADNASRPTAIAASPAKMYITIDHVTAPLIGVLILLATTTIGGDQIRSGIVGEAGIEPYDVLLLFISLAYIAISLDATGLLRYLALLICLKSGRRGQEGSGMKLYLLLYFFFWTAGVLVGNDPVILSGTAFLVYLTRVAGITPPDAWIWAEFVAANISSAVLVSSNPTNLVIATGFGVEFITYTAYMVLPAFASAVAALGCLLLFFRNRNTVDGARRKGNGAAPGKDRAEAPVPANEIDARPTDGQMRHRSAVRASSLDSNDPPHPVPDTSGSDRRTEAAAGRSDGSKRTPLIYIPHRIIQPDVDARSALVDLPGAIFGSFIMAATLATLVGTSVVGGIKVFQIALPGAALCLLRDGVADWVKWRSERKRVERERGEALDRETAAAGTKREDRNGGIEMAALGASEPAKLGSQHPSSYSTPATEPHPSSTAPIVTAPTPRAHRPLRPLLLLPSRLSLIFPTVAVVLSRLPLPLLPFAFGMFILVQALAHVGFINILAGGLGTVCAEGYVPTAFFVAVLGVVLCNLGGTNIGSTILLTKSILSPFFEAKLSHLAQEERERIMKMATYSIAFGSNVGALGGTFAASLAGLLWLEGLKQGGITVRARQFALWCAVVIGPATAAGIAVLIAEVRYFDL